LPTLQKGKRGGCGLSTTIGASSEQQFFDEILALNRFNKALLLIKVKI